LSLLLGDDTTSQESIYHNFEDRPHVSSSFSSAGDDWFANVQTVSTVEKNHLEIFNF